MVQFLRLEIQIVLIGKNYTFFFFLFQVFEGLCRMRKANGELGYRYGQSWTFKIRHG